MMYESEAVRKNDSLYVEHNTVTALVGAKAKKLGLAYSDIYEPTDKDLVNKALQPLYDFVDRQAWRIEYLLRAIQNSLEGKALTKEGAYLDSKFHQYLTTDGRLRAPKVGFKGDSKSILLQNEDKKTIALCLLNFQDMVYLRTCLNNTILSEIDDLRTNLEDIKKDPEDPDKSFIPDMEATLKMWEEAQAEWKKKLANE